MKRIVSLLSAFCMLALFFSYGSVHVRAASGTIGSCTWTLDGTVLTIRGNGSMGYDVGSPWGIGITELIIEEGVTDIANSTFSNCTSLRKVTLPKSLRSIGAMSFRQCVSLTSLIIPEGVIAIENGAFSGCTALLDVTIPKTVTSLGEEFFTDCYSLISISIDENNPSFKSVDGVVFSKDMTKLIKYPQDKAGMSYTVPDTVTEISAKAFHKANHLYDVYFPDTITKIGHSAFFQTIMYHKADNYINGCLYLDDYLIYFKDTEAEEFSVREGTRVIADGAFAHLNAALKRVFIPDSVVAIGETAFAWCYNLETVIIPQNVTYIGRNAFYECTKLKNVYYRGDKTNQSKIFIGGENEELTSASWSYNACYKTAQHTWSEPVVKKQVSCLENGMTEKHCTVCNVKQTQNIPALGHNYTITSQSKAATCVEAGLQESFCSTCGHVKTAVLTPSGHVYGPWTTEIPFTCTDIGVEKRTCVLCGAAEARNTEADGHSFGEWKAEEKASCTDVGVQKRTCASCGAVEEESMAATEHVFGEWKTEREPACDDDGIENRVCTVCGTHEERSLTALGHDFGEAVVIKEPTVEEEGLRMSVCRICGEEKTETIAPREELGSKGLILTISVVLIVTVLALSTAGIASGIVKRCRNKR